LAKNTGANKQDNTRRKTYLNSAKRVQQSTTKRQGNAMQSPHGISKSSSKNEQQVQRTTIQEHGTRRELEGNIKHFGQTEGTAFTTEALIAIFGKDGESQATDDLLQGKLPNIKHLPDSVQRILRKIAKNLCKDQIDTKVTTQELKDLYKKWKERTSTSPLGRCHLGHWHALQAPDGDHPKAEHNQYLGNKIMTIHANIMNAATLSGIPPDRWIPVDSPMLAKSKGKPRINKLRVIHLYEADYNGLLKTVWPHRAVQHATKGNVSITRKGTVKKDDKRTT
jgi:hypothetical protein